MKYQVILTLSYSRGKVWRDFLLLPYNPLALEGSYETHNDLAYSKLSTGYYIDIGDAQFQLMIMFCTVHVKSRVGIWSNMESLIGR